jgi:hypothetical protein
MGPCAGDIANASGRGGALAGLWAAGAGALLLLCDGAAVASFPPPNIACAGANASAASGALSLATIAAGRFYTI